jgi:hypothetical protein
VGCSGVKAVGDIYELGISVTLSVLGDNKEKVRKINLAIVMEPRLKVQALQVRAMMTKA